MVIKVFVGNLPENATEDALHDLFAPYGQIPELHIVKNFAFVSFANRQDADNAVKDLHQTKMLGHTLIVEISKKQDSRGDSRRDGPRRPPQGQYQGPARGPPRNPGPPLAGGILGAAPLEQPNPLGPLGIFSAVNTLAAVENQVRNADILMEQQHAVGKVSNNHTPPRRMSPEPDRRRDAGYGGRDEPERRSAGDGYVIYERYYVDPSHPLLKGLPLPKLNRITDSYVAPREPESRSSYADYRPRSPGPVRNAGPAHDNLGRDFRGRDYGRVDPYERR